AMVAMPMSIDDTVDDDEIGQAVERILRAIRCKKDELGLWRLLTAFPAEFIHARKSQLNGLCAWPAKELDVFAIQLVVEDWPAASADEVASIICDGLKRRSDLIELL